MACCITSCPTSRASPCASGSTASSGFPSRRAVHHGCAIASALDYANRHGVMHRDVKPENVMLYEGEAMVMDFGIAKAVSAADSETLTQVGMMIGTPAYVSPEQASGETQPGWTQRPVQPGLHDLRNAQRRAPVQRQQRAGDHGQALHRDRQAVAQRSRRRCPRASSAPLPRPWPPIPPDGSQRPAQFAHGLVLRQHEHAQRHHGACRHRWFPWPSRSRCCRSRT